MIIVIPTYNERENVARMVAGIRAIISNAKILFVDDASPDGTAQEIKKIQAQDSNVLLFERAGKLGLGSAYVQAFEKIIAENLDDVVVTMDADLSHPFEVLKSFEEKIKDYDLVVGSRYTKGGRIQNWSWIRRIISRLGNWYERLLINLPIRDASSGFMCVRVESLKKID